MNYLQSRDFGSIFDIESTSHLCIGSPFGLDSVLSRIYLIRLSLQTIIRWRYNRSRTGYYEIAVLLSAYRQAAPLEWSLVLLGYKDLASPSPAGFGATHLYTWKRFEKKQIHEFTYLWIRRFANLQNTTHPCRIKSLNHFLAKGVKS